MRFHITDKKGNVIQTGEVGFPGHTETDNVYLDAWNELVTNVKAQGNKLHKGWPKEK